MSITGIPPGTCGAPGALKGARRVREAARRNGSIERRDRASGRLHHPQPPATGAEAQDAHVGTVHNVALADRATAYHPALTGMSHQALARLTATLTDAWTDQREARRHRRRGGQRRHAPGGGGVPKLDLADRVVAALLHLRFHASSVLIGQLLGVNRITAARAVKQILPLLIRHGYLGPPQPIARIHTIGDAHACIATHRRPVPQDAPTVLPQRSPQPKTACY
jgi:hypothetical protein